MADKQIENEIDPRDVLARVQQINPDLFYRALAEVRNTLLMRVINEQNQKDSQEDES